MCNCLVYVVDSNGHDRIGEAKHELARMLNEDETRGWPLLVLANKQDMPNAMYARVCTHLHECSACSMTAECFAV